MFFFFKQKTAYEMRISDWSSDVCSSDLLIFAGRYAEAEALADAEVQAVPMREMSYQALGDLHIDLVGINETAAEQYRRELDLDSAIARSRFIAEGVTYTREAFASASDGVIVVSLGAEGEIGRAHV